MKWCLPVSINFFRSSEVVKEIKRMKNLKDSMYILKAL